jgi:phosphoserine phosphatase RsbU/P
LTTAGIVLGVLAEIELGQREVDLLPGDCLVFYTDGVTEALNGVEEEFGRERLVTAVSDILTSNPDLSAQGLVDELLAAVRAFTGDAAQHDDITLCVVKWVGE